MRLDPARSWCCPDCRRTVRTSRRGMFCARCTAARVWAFRGRRFAHVYMDEYAPFPLTKLAEDDEPTEPQPPRAA